MAKASNGGKKGRASRKTTRGAERRRRLSPKRGSVLAELPLEEWDDVVGTGYFIESFDIRKMDVANSIDTAVDLAREAGCDPNEFDHSGWRSAYIRTHPHDPTWRLTFGEFRGHLIDWGVVVGVDESEMLRRISAEVKATKTNDLYATPIDGTKREINAPFAWIPPLTVSDRDLADERVGVAIALVFEDFLWPLVATAVDIARDAALIVGRDVAAAPERYGLTREPLPMKQASGAERDRLTRSAPDALRKYLKTVLRDPAVVRRVGRQVEAERDHRAYCMRERLVHSDEFMRMKRNTRYALARERVIAEVIAPLQGGCSKANFQRVMDAGRAVHLRAVPNLPYCDRWPLPLEASRK